MTAVLDVVLVGDLRLPGGASRRLALEIDLLTRSGARVGLLGIRSDLVRGAAPWNPAVVAAAGSSLVSVLDPSDQISTRALILRHPSTLRGAADVCGQISADRVEIVCNQATRDATGTVRYVPRDVHDEVRRATGHEPTWWPTSEAIRAELVQVGEHVAERNWLTLGRGLAFVVADRPRSSRGRLRAFGRLATDLVSRYDPVAVGAVVDRSRYPNVTLVSGTGEAHEATAEEAIATAAGQGDVVLVDEELREVLPWAGPVYPSGQALEDVLEDVLRDGPRDLRTRAGDLLLARLGLSPRQVVPRVTRTDSSRPRIVFVTSNGAGMGHLTRELGIARALGDAATPIFVSMSQGVPAVSSYGFAYEYTPANSALQLTPRAWNEYYVERLGEALETYEPAAVVFDGVWPYGGLVRALRAFDGATVWVRRGMWKPHISPDQLRKSHDFDLVIEPGDYAAAYDEGATSKVSGARKVSPITVVSHTEGLDREAARDELGLPRDAKIALVTLGAGNINDTQSLQAEVVRSVRALGPEWLPVVTHAAIAGRKRTSDAVELSVFPLARCAAAFDFAVSAAGYNSFHEWINAALPTIWVPNHATVTDDQAARARYAADVGLGIALMDPTPEAIATAVRTMADGDHRRKVRSDLEGVRRENGAVEAADLVLRLLNRKGTRA